MSSNWIKLIGLFVLLVLLQIGLFDKIHLAGYATPLLYIYFIIKLPIDMNRNTVLLLSALMGLVIDLSGYTLGLHMLACTVTGFFRFPILKLFTPRDLFESVMPSFSSFGAGLFIRYSATLTIIHMVVLYGIEALTLFDPVYLLLCIAGSFIITFILILACESLNLNSLRK